jgi:peptide/nickel transport system substrate-binding protein
MTDPASIAHVYGHLVYGLLVCSLVVVCSAVAFRLPKIAMRGLRSHRTVSPREPATMSTNRRIRRTAALAAAASLALAAPLAAQDLRLGIAAEPSSLDPHYHALSPNISLQSHVFEKLVSADAKETLQPQLAESWKVLPDGITWEFKLRRGVTWHDGSPFTADDVLYAFERVPSVPNSPGLFSYATKGKTLTRIDDHTVHISTGAPSPLTPNDMTAVFIVPKKHAATATTADFNSGKGAIGTGPFKFAEYIPGDRIVFTRNDAYWGSKPAFAKVTFKPIKAGPARTAALLAGDVDLIDDVPTADIERLKGDAKVELHQAASNRSIFFAMDQFRDDSPFVKAKDGSTIKNPLRDKRVRLALSKAINREAIVQRVMEKAAIPASQYLPEGYFGILQGAKPVAYDLDGAKKLLAEAGFPNGFKLTLHGPNGRYTNDVKVIEAVAQMFTRVGIETAIETIPPGPFFTRASTGLNGQPEFSMMLLGWSPSSGENSGALKPQLMSFNRDKGTGTANRGRYSDPAFDKIVDEALQTVDDAKRAALLADATKRAIDDTAWIPLHYQINTWASRKGLAYTARSDEYTLAMGVAPKP